MLESNLTEKHFVIDDLIDITLKAGDTAMAIYARDHDVAIKQDNSPVTEADLAVDNLLFPVLCELYPDIPIVTEERAATHGATPQSGRFFLVDPIDGTKEFIKKGRDFTVNIALIERGVPTFGIVYAPALKRMFVAKTPDCAVQMDVRDGKYIGAEAAISVRDAPDSGVVAVASKSHRDEQTNAFLEKHGIRDIVSTGSSLKFCLVAAGEADIYPRFGPTMEWDTAAGQAVLQAAGGRVVHPDGSPFRYNKPDFRNGFFIASGRAHFELE